jgi:hypothetical protein
LRPMPLAPRISNVLNCFNTRPALLGDQPGSPSLAEEGAPVGGEGPVLAGGASAIVWEVCLVIEEGSRIVRANSALAREGSSMVREGRFRCGRGGFLGCFNTRPALVGGWYWAPSPWGRDVSPCVPGSSPLGDVSPPRVSASSPRVPRLSPSGETAPRPGSLLGRCLAIVEEPLWISAKARVRSFSAPIDTLPGRT